MTKIKLAAASLLLLGSAASASALELHDVSLYQAPIAGTYYANQAAQQADNARNAFARSDRAPVAAVQSSTAQVIW